MPGLGTLAKQIADAREALVAVKKQIKEEAVSRATVACSDGLVSCLALEQGKSSRLERELQVEQMSKKALVLTMSRGQGFNSRLNQELD